MIPNNLTSYPECPNLETILPAARSEHEATRFLGHILCSPTYNKRFLSARCTGPLYSKTLELQCRDRPMEGQMETTTRTEKCIQQAN